ncbi:MAG: class I SAM-dependent methyltransferase [Candidatus Nanoarchaeia archaeon]
MIGPVEERFLVSRIGEYVDSDKPRMLDVGCGYGSFGMLFNGGLGLYVGVDVDVDLLECGNKAKNYHHPNLNHLHLINGDARKLPVVGPYEIVLFSQSWHHIACEFGDGHRALEEADRVLADGGIIAIVEPTWQALRGLKFYDESSPAYDEEMALYKQRQFEAAEIVIDQCELFSVAERKVCESGNPDLTILRRA